MFLASAWPFYPLNVERGTICETGETSETGEESIYSDAERRPSMEQHLKFSNNCILTGLTGLTGLPDHIRVCIEWPIGGKKNQRRNP